MPVVTALLALGCLSCGGSTASTSRSASPAALAMSVARHLCPQALVRVNRDMAPARVLAKSATPVLVPGHPTGLVVCRFGALDNPGVPGALAGAVSVAREDAIRRLAGEFDALRPIPRYASCPVFGGRSELFVFAIRPQAGRECCCEWKAASRSQMGGSCSTVSACISPAAKSTGRTKVCSDTYHSLEFAPSSGEQVECIQPGFLPSVWGPA